MTRRELPVHVDPCPTEWSLVSCVILVYIVRQITNHWSQATPGTTKNLWYASIVLGQLFDRFQSLESLWYLLKSQGFGSPKWKKHSHGVNDKLLRGLVRCERWEQRDGACEWVTCRSPSSRVRELAAQHTNNSQQLAARSLLFSLSLESHLNSATKLLGDLLTSPNTSCSASGRRMTQTLMGLPMLLSHDPLGVSNRWFLRNVWFHVAKKNNKDFLKTEVQKAVAAPPSLVFHADLRAIPFSFGFYL